jgi:hypothetical protein
LLGLIDTANDDMMIIIYDNGDLLK